MHQEDDIITIKIIVGEKLKQSFRYFLYFMEHRVMKKFIRKISVYLSIIMVFSVYGQEVQFSITGDNLDSVYSLDGFTLTLGLHQDATNGPELDDFDTPSVPPSLFVQSTAFVSFIGNETPLIEEFKPLAEDSLVWRLRIEFGTPDGADKWRYCFGLG